MVMSMPFSRWYQFYRESVRPRTFLQKPVFPQQMTHPRRRYLVVIFNFLALLFLLSVAFLGRKKLTSVEASGQPEDPDRQPWDDIDRSQLQAWTNVDWSQFAYVQYATDLPYLCNSVMLFESLHHLGCKPDRLLMYPSNFALEGNDTEALLLKKARDKYNVILKPVEIRRRASLDRELLNHNAEEQTEVRSSYLGGELYKASGIQPDRIQTSSPP